MALSMTVKRNTVFGDMKIIFATVAVTTTADELDTGLSWVFHCSTTNQDTLADGNDIQVVLNSNDGTAGTSAGEVYFDIEASDTLDIMVVGKP